MTLAFRIETCVFLCRFLIFFLVFAFCTICDEYRFSLQLAVKSAVAVDQKLCSDPAFKNVITFDSKVGAGAALGELECVRDNFVTYAKLSAAIL